MMWIGQTDLYQSFPPAQRAATLVPPVIWLAVLMRSRRIAAILDAMPCSWLIGLQLYRVLGGVFLVQWAVGRAPGAFAVPAGTGDLLTGLLALPVAIYVSKRASHWRLVGYAWNLFGLADFAMALSIAIFFAPPGLRYPLNMIPTFGLPLGIVLHVLSLWQLSRTQTAATSAPQSEPGVASVGSSEVDAPSGGAFCTFHAHHGYPAVIKVPGSLQRGLSTGERCEPITGIVGG